MIALHTIWGPFRLSHVSREAIEQYELLPKSCESHYAGRYRSKTVCESDIAKLDVTENEKYWLNSNNLMLAYLDLLVIFLA